MAFDMMDGRSMLKDPTTGKSMFAWKLMRWNTRSRYNDMPNFSIHSKGNKKFYTKNLFNDKMCKHILGVNKRPFLLQ